MLMHLKISSTWKVERQTLVTFFGDCVREMDFIQSGERPASGSRQATNN
jgi:hypothetical protein